MAEYSFSLNGLVTVRARSRCQHRHVADSIAGYFLIRLKAALSSELRQTKLNRILAKLTQAKVVSEERPSVLKMPP